MLSTQSRIRYRTARVNAQLPPAVIRPDSHRAHTLVSLPKILVQKILSSPRGKEALRAIIKQSENVHSKLLNPCSSEILVDTFINAINSEANFPVIVIDENVKNRFGLIWSTEGVTNGRDLQIGRFEISIDSMRVEQMVQADRLPNKEPLEVYQFQLACTLLRNVGQIFGFYLKHHTSTITPLEAVFKSKSEEAGVLLESEIFGESIDWFRDPEGGDAQPGQPFRPDIDDSGRVMSWRRVNHEYIRRLVNHTLSFPAVADGELIAVGARQPLFLPE